MECRDLTYGCDFFCNVGLANFLQICTNTDIFISRLNNDISSPWLFRSISFSPCTSGLDSHPHFVLLGFGLLSYARVTSPRGIAPQWEFWTDPACRLVFFRKALSQSRRCDVSFIVRALPDTWGPAARPVQVMFSGRGRLSVSLGQHSTVETSLSSLKNA